MLLHRGQSHHCAQQHQCITSQNPPSVRKAIKSHASIIKRASHIFICVMALEELLPMPYAMQNMSFRSS